MKPLTKKEVKEKITEAVDKGNVSFAPTSEIDELQLYVKVIMERFSKFLGNDSIKSAWISDRSHFSDFYMDTTINYRTLSEAVGVEVSRNDADILSAARKLKAFELASPTHSKPNPN